MIQNIFLDTNIIIDFLVQRPPFSEDAKKLFYMKENAEIDLFASALSFGTASYYIEKSKGNPFVLLSKLLKLVEVIDLTKEVIEQSVRSDFKDFEDALQYYSAKQRGNIDVLITRNEKYFKHVSIPVMSTSAFLKKHKR